MDKLLQMKIVLVPVLFILSAITATAQDRCSLIVKVVDPSEHEVEARITVKEQNGRLLRAENEPGGAKFCDLGILPVTVSVGSAACNQVTVQSVPLEWGHTRTTKVVYDRGPCLQDLPPLALCHILFRFSDEEGKWLSGVSFDPPAKGAESATTDSFGRVLVNTSLGEQLQTLAKKEGYISQSVRLTCTRDILLTEQPMKLQKSK